MCVDVLMCHQDVIPVIAIMCNPGIRKRHWDKMNQIAGFNLTPDAGTTLRKVLKLELQPYMDMFEGISASATKVGVNVFLFKLTANL